jgi:hypothetical protein
MASACMPEAIIAALVPQIAASAPAMCLMRIAFWNWKRPARRPNDQAIACTIIVAPLLGNYLYFWFDFDFTGCTTVGNDTCVQLQGIR